MEKGDAVRHPFAIDVEGAILAHRSSNLQSAKSLSLVVVPSIQVPI